MPVEDQFMVARDALAVLAPSVLEQQHRRDRQRPQIGLRAPHGVAPRRKIPLNERGRRFPGGEGGMPEHGDEEATVRGQPERHRVLERNEQPAARFFARRTMGDHLRQHRIVERADALARRQP